MEEKVLYGVLTAYRERGNYLRRLEQFDKAKVAYDEALKYYPEDSRLLIGRSQTCADAMKPLEAFQNADLALKINQYDMQARNVQARALFAISEFESSLLMNFRGSWRRVRPPYFLEGISQGLEVLEDCIGKNAGSVMTDFLPIIVANEPEIDDDNEPVIKKRKSRIPRKEDTKKLTQMQVRKHKQLSRVLAMKYLDRLADDKFFLQNLSNDKRLNGANSQKSKELKEIVNDTLRTLHERQEMLRAQRPYYSVKMRENTKSSHMQEFKEKLLERECEINTKSAEKLMAKVEEALRQNKMMSVITQAERFQKFLDTKTPQTLPDKEHFIDRLYRAVGMGYLGQYRLSYRLSEGENIRRIRFLMGLPVGRAKSFDSVIANYPMRFVDIKEATEHAIKLYEMCENPLMKCWLLYEISCLLTQQKNYAMAKFYAKRCQYEALKLDCPTWWMNGCFVIISGDMKQGNHNDVKTAIAEAMEMSKNLKSREQVQAFLQQCLEVASHPIDTSEATVEMKRQQDILKVMYDEEKVDMKVFLKRISQVPPRRRFKVMPTPPPPVPAMESERRHYHQRGLTVLPGIEKGLRPLPHSKNPGYQTFDVENGD